MANTGAIKAGRAFVEMFADNSKLQRDLKAAEKMFKAYGKRVTAMGTKIFAVGAGVTTFFAGAAKVFGDAGDQLDKMSLRTGVSASALSALGFAAEQSGSSLEAVEQGIKGMQRSILNLDRGLSTSTDSFDAIGVSIEDLQGLNPEDQFTLLADKVAAIEDPSMRAALAMQVFGRSGSQLLPLLANGATGVADLRKEAEELGIIMSEEDVKAAAAFTDAMNRVRRQLGKIVIDIGASVAPALTRMSDKITEVLRGTIDWINNNRGLIFSVAKIGTLVMAAGAAVIGFGLTLTLIGTAIAGAGSLISILVAGFTFLISPIGIVIALMTAMAGWFFYATESGRQAFSALGQHFQTLLEIVKDVFGGIMDALKAGDFQLAAQILFLSLKVAFLKGVQPLQEIWAGLMLGLESAWINSFATIEQLLIKSSANISRVYSGLVNDLAKKIVRLMAYFDSSIDADDAVNILDEDQRRKESEIESKRTAAIKNSKEKQSSALADAESRSGDKVSSANKELADAQNALKNSIVTAREGAKKEASFGSKISGPTVGSIGNQQAAASNNAKNTGVDFRSAEGASRLVSALNGGGADLKTDKLVKASEKTAANTDRMVANDATRPQIIAGGA